MKVYRRTAIILAALAALLMAMPGFAKSTTAPAKAPAKQKRAKAESAPESDHTYVVRRGDNLIQIARAHQITVKKLKAANGLKSSRIKAGQKLIVPVIQNAGSGKKPLPDAAQPSKPVDDTIAQYISRPEAQNPAAEEGEPPLRLRLVEAGFQMIGVRYRFSGGSEKTGFDCSGLVKNLFSKFDISLPRSSREQYKQGEKIDRDKLEVGDLVFFSSGGKTPTHVGIYIGDDKFLHAARKARQVVVSDLNKIWYAMRYLGARRISDLWNDDTDPEPKQE